MRNVASYVWAAQQIITVLIIVLSLSLTVYGSITIMHSSAYSGAIKYQSINQYCQPCNAARGPDRSYVQLKK